MYVIPSGVYSARRRIKSDMVRESLIGVANDTSTLWITSNHNHPLKTIKEPRFVLQLRKLIISCGFIGLLKFFNKVFGRAVSLIPHSIELVITQIGINE